MFMLFFDFTFYIKGNLEALELNKNNFALDL